MLARQQEVYQALVHADASVNAGQHGAQVNASRGSPRRNVGFADEYLPSSGSSSMDRNSGSGHGCGTHSTLSTHSNHSNHSGHNNHKSHSQSPSHSHSHSPSHSHRRSHMATPGLGVHSHEIVLAEALAQQEAEYRAAGERVERVPVNGSGGGGGGGTHVPGFNLMGAPKKYFCQ